MIQATMAKTVERNLSNAGRITETKKTMEEYLQEAYTFTTTHTNAPLQDLVVSYLGADDFFGEDAVVPEIFSPKKSDLYYRHNQRFGDQDFLAVRADGAESAAGELGITSATFTTIVYSGHIDLGDQIAANYDSPLNLESDIAGNLGRAVAINVAKEFALILVSTSWSGASAFTPTIKWDVAGATSVPYSDILGLHESFAAKNGINANSLFLTRDIIRAFKTNDQISERIVYGGSMSAPARVTVEVLADLFEVENLIVVQSFRNTSSTDDVKTLSYFTSDAGLMCYLASGGLLNRQNAIVKFVWSGYAGDPVSVTQERINLKASSRYEVIYAYAFQIINPDLGIRIASPLT